MDLDVIIYLVIIVGSLVVSFVQKKAKQKERNKSETFNREIPEKSLKEIFGDIFDNTPAFGEIPKPVFSKKNTPEQIAKTELVHKTMSLPKSDNQNRQIMHDSLAEKSYIKHIIVEEDTPARQFDLKLDNIEEWQKVFVYSEIFSRKY